MQEFNNFCRMIETLDRTEYVSMGNNAWCIELAQY